MLIWSENLKSTWKVMWDTDKSVLKRECAAVNEIIKDSHS